MNFNQFKTQFQKKEVTELTSKVSADPVVSVCVQAFQHGSYIQECLEGILMQKTSFPIEILLAEDASEDNTRELCLNLAKRYPDKIRLFLHSRSNNIRVLEEPTPNFPTLYNLFSAKGKYIAICEGDDYWTDPHKLQKQYSFMEKNSDFSVCYHDFRMIRMTGESENASIASSLKGDLKANDLVFPWKHPATLTIFFRNKFQEIPEEATRVINLDVFLYSLLGRIGKGKYIEDIAPAGYRIHSSGLWSSRSSEKKILSRIVTFKELGNYYQRIGKPQITQKLKNRNYKLYHSLIYAAASSRKYRKTVYYFQEYLKYRTI